MHKGSDRELFFKKQKTNRELHNPLVFLQKYPRQEIWRFFVEQTRYRCHETLYREMSQFLEKKHVINELEKDASSISVANLTVRNFKNLYDFSSVDDRTRILNDVRRTVEGIEDTELTLWSLMKRQIGWLGFEDIEPGYFSGMIDGFCYLIANLDRPNLELAFILELHHKATSSVLNMSKCHRAGKFRANDYGIQWDLLPDTCSLAGLIESFDYLQEELDSGVELGIEYRVIVDSVWRSIDYGKSRETKEKIASLIFDSMKDKSWQIECGWPTKLDKSGFSLVEVCEKLINTFNTQIKLAQNSEEKVKIIFIFLKRSVLNHFFYDGVGRVFSMLLLQYLLMRENLFPYLIDNSNKIPSFSVEELTRDYFKAEELMQKMLELNTEQQRIEFLSSDSLCAQNISLEDVFKEATEEEKNKYMAKIQQFDAAVQSYIDQQLMYNPPPLLN